MPGSFIGKPGIELVGAVIIEFAKRIDGDVWTQDPGFTNCWSDAIPEGKPVRVEENGVEYIEQLTLDDCDDNAGSWYWDTSGYLYVHTTGSDDPGGGTYIILAYFYDRIASHEIVLDGHPYKGYLDKSSIPSISLRTGGYQEGGTQESFGTLRFNNADGYFDTRLDTYIYEAKRIWLYLGEYGKLWADYFLYWPGWTASITWSDTYVDIDIEDLRMCVL